MRIQNKIVLSFALALMITPAVSAQRRATPARPAEVDVTIALQIGAQPYQFEGNGVCQHAPVASIFNVMAEMWRVQQSDGQRWVMLTVWRPRNLSGDMVSLIVSTGGKSYVVNTVKTGGERAVRGSGTVTITTSGGGGTFTINATEVNGAAVKGTIKCSAFPQVMAEAG